MKQISILFLYFLCSICIYAQDTILLKNGQIINATIIERNKSKIKYQHVQNAKTDTTLSLRLSKIRTIHYGNGKVDLLSSQNPRSIFPLGVNFGFTIPFLTGSIDYLITPNLSAEIELKNLLSTSYHLYSFSVGGKYWFANKYGKSGFSPFAGLFYSRVWVQNDYEDITWFNKPEWSASNYLEMPIGISYITKFGLQTSIQLNNSYNIEYDKLSLINSIEFRVGWRFKNGKK